MKEEKYTGKIHFDDDFIENFINLTVNFDSDIYIKSLKLIIEYSAEHFNYFYNCHRIFTTKSCTFEEYKTFLYKSPILIQFGILHTKILNACEQFKSLQSQKAIIDGDYFLFLDTKKYLARQMKKIFSLMPSNMDNIEDKYLMLEDYDFVVYCYDKPDIVSYYKLRYLFIVLELTLNVIQALIINYKKNVNLLFNSYVYDTFLQNDEINIEIRKKMENKRKLFLKNGIILGNLNKSHGGNKRLTTEDKIYISKRKKVYDIAYNLYRKLKAITNQLAIDKICIFKALHNIGNLNLDENDYKECKEIISQNVICPIGNTFQKCKYCKHNLCIHNDYQKNNWDILNYIIYNYKGYMLPIEDINYTILDTKEQKNLKFMNFILNHTEQELALLSTKEHFEYKPLSQEDTKAHERFKTKSSKTMLNMFSEYKDFNYIRQPNVEFLEKAYICMKYYQGPENEAQKQELLRLIK